MPVLELQQHGRREDIYLRKAQLVSALASVTPKARRVFDPLGSSPATRASRSNRCRTRRSRPSRPGLVTTILTLATQQRLFGYTEEELRVILAPMAGAGAEPIGSMGNDTPLAALSDPTCTDLRLLHPAIRAGH